jgi:hypothetical protein
MDLASLLSIQRCANHLHSLHKPIHILINNAGTKETSTKLTVDGFELQWQVNHLGPFYFTQLVMPLLVEAGRAECPARVLFTASIMNYVYCTDEGIDFEALSKEASLPDPFRRYAESKLAAIVTAKEWTRRFQTEREQFLTETPETEPPQDKENSDKSIPYVISVSLHPGVCSETRIYRSWSFQQWCIFIYRLASKGTGKIMRKEKFKSLAQASATTVYCALHPHIESGEYYANCAVSPFVHPQAMNESMWKQIWDFSERQIANRLEQLQQVRERVKSIVIEK